MANQNRTSLLTKAHKVLKKHYKPIPIPERSVLEHLLYATCLENAHYETADKAYLAVSTGFFDWNEVRVSTVKELAEVMHALPNPNAPASNLKRILQSVFESTYSFDLEALKKQNLGQAQQRLQKFEGATHFAVAYVTQATLGGHSIPVDRGLLGALVTLGIIDEQEAAEGAVPGLERAIPKNKGVEFGSLAHQLAAEFIANPYSPALHKILIEISADAKDRLPKKQTRSGRSKDEAPAATGTKAPADTARKKSVAKKLDEAKPEPSREPLPKAPLQREPAQKPPGQKQAGPRPPASKETAEKSDKSKSKSEGTKAEKGSPKKKTAAAPPKRKPR